MISSKGEFVDQVLSVRQYDLGHTKQRSYQRLLAGHSFRARIASFQPTACTRSFRGCDLGRCQAPHSFAIALARTDLWVPASARLMVPTSLPPQVRDKPGELPEICLRSAGFQRSKWSGL